jgi:Tol biopolymer transport system component
MPGRSLLRTLAALLALAIAGTAAAGLGTAPGKNGRIVFRRYLDAKRSTGALFTVNPDGTNVKRVTRPPRGVVDQEADWSPNGKRIVFERKVPCRNGLDNTCDRIYAVNRDGKGLKSLIPCGFKGGGPPPGDCVGVHTPAWSPDGSKIAFRYSLVDSDYVDSLKVNSGIWIANSDGTGRRQITQRTPGTAWDFGPQWSPDGTKLVFGRVDRKRNADAVFTVNVDGSGEFQVTPWELTAGNSPDWSPDGRWLLFTAQPRDGSANVYKVHPDGSGLVNLTNQSQNGYHYTSSSFSPDGAMIITARTPGAGRAADLVVMKVDGSRIRPIMRTKRWESAPDWGPRR